MIRQFFTHLFPKTVFEDTLFFRKTGWLGCVVVALLFLLVFTGVLLLFYYSPAPSSAYSSVLFLENSVTGGVYIRSLHRMCSHLLLIFAALHLMRTVFSGAYSLRPVNWKLGYIIFALIIFEAYTGYLLPMDQLSFWATKTGMELMNTLPLGQAIKTLLLPDDVGGRLTLLRFFALHIVMIPFFCALLVSSHLYNIRRDGGLVRYVSDKKTDGSRLISLAGYTALAVFVFSLVMSLVFPAPLDVRADPSTPPNPAKSAWFLLWIQEVVSWRASLFNLVALVFAVYYFMPNIGHGSGGERAVWFSKKDRAVWISTVLLAVFIIVLTVIALYFRGKNWELVPFYF